MKLDMSRYTWNITNSSMKVKAMVMVGWLLLGCLHLQARIVTDMAGRKVNVPERITRVLPFDNKTNELIYPVAGNLMMGKARAMENAALKYMANDFLSLREVDMKNAEEVMRLKPDLLIVATFVDDHSLLERYEEFANKVHIPLVVVDLELMKLDKSYDFLGSLLHKVPEASACSAFLRKIFTDTEDFTRGKRVAGKALMANDRDGLRTVPSGSNHGQLFEVMKIPNASTVDMDSKGFAQVSVEQVLVWNPDYIFCIGKGESNPYRNILKSAVWRNVTAVRSHRVFFVPAEPYSWFDMPPSVNRVLGLIWFADIFYNQPNQQTRQKVMEFYKLFYHYSLTEKEYNGLFKWQ